MTIETARELSYALITLPIYYLIMRLFLWWAKKAAGGEDITWVNGWAWGFYFWSPFVQCVIKIVTS